MVSKKFTRQDLYEYRREEEDKRDLGLLSDLDQLKLEIENDPNIILKVPKKLSRNLDPIVKATKFPDTVNHPKKNMILPRII